MPDRVRQTQPALLDSLARARRFAMTVILPVICLLSIATLVLTNDGLSYHAYNTSLYSFITLWFLLAWCGVRLYPHSEFPHMFMLFGGGFFLVVKLIALMFFSKGNDFSLGLLESMMWLYATIVFSLISSTLVFYWYYVLNLLSLLSLISLIYCFYGLDISNSNSNLSGLIQLNFIGWIILIGSKGYLIRKEIHTA
ncbi:MAG: hypothetical protein JWQ08_509, partial [Deinococcus sp.]|nr:hypothetical protein [Deinococcus sp.]